MCSSDIKNLRFCRHKMVLEYFIVVAIGREE